MRTFIGTSCRGPGRERWAEPEEGDSPRSRVTAVISRLGEGGKSGEVAQILQHLRAITGVASSRELPDAILGMFPRHHDEAEPLVRRVRAAIVREAMAPAHVKFESLFRR